MTILLRFIPVMKPPFLFLLLGTTASAVDFNRDVRPVLAQQCFTCHGMDDHGRKGKLRLDLPESAHGAGKSGEIAIVPGKPDASEVIKRQSGQPIEEYVQKTFYQPLGLGTMGYRPYEKFPIERIPPTENDDYFRDRRIQGYVHDMGAAMLNQATGHAGLFSTAEDLAVLMQMLLNKGSYGGMQYLKPETISYYTTRCQGCTRRGIGFDMFQQNTNYENNLSKLASEGTYGHLGFTVGDVPDIAANCGMTEIPQDLNAVVAVQDLVLARRLWSGPDDHHRIPARLLDVGGQLVP